jgi:hypothetical protein
MDIYGLNNSIYFNNSHLIRLSTILLRRDDRQSDEVGTLRAEMDEVPALQLLR